MFKKVIFTKIFLSSNAVLVYLSMMKLLIHLLTLQNYGYFGDEFYYISTSKHLNFGFVDLPPLAPLLMAVTRLLFGESQIAIHIFPAIAGSLTVFFTGLITRELGGRRFAEFLSCLMVIAAPAWLAMNSNFTYDPFDTLFSSVFFLETARLLKNETRGKWIMLGIIAGAGIMTKLTMIFICSGFVTAFLLTKRRIVFLSLYPWLAAIIAFTICVPFLLWQYFHGFPLLIYLHNYSLIMPHPLPHQFLLEQALYLNPVACPVWLIGIYYLIFKHEGKNHLILGLVFPLLFLLIAVILRLEVRQIIPACFPILAGGAVFFEKKIMTGKWSFLKPAFCILLAAFGILSLPRVLPVLSLAGMEKYYSRNPAFNNAIKQGSADSFSDIPLIFSYRLGWPEMVHSVADIYYSLPQIERQKCVIYTGTYSEAGAVDLIGKSFGLPEAICNHLSYQFWGPGDKGAEWAIVIGSRFSYELLYKIFNDVSFVSTINTNRLYVSFERNIPVFICHGPKKNLRDIWPELQYFY
jgi:hypothetical protein